MVEWLRLYNSESGEVHSGWIRSIGWRDQALILRRYDDDPENAETYRYEPVPYDIFREIKHEYEQMLDDDEDGRNHSVGSIVNHRVINNPDVPAAEKL